MSTEDEAAVRRQVHLWGNILRNATSGQRIQPDETTMLHQSILSKTFKGALSDSPMVHKLPEPPDVITGNVVEMTCESVYSHIDEIYDYDVQGHLDLLESAHLRENYKRLCNEGITLLWDMVHSPKSTSKEKFYASLGLLTCVNAMSHGQEPEHCMATRESLTKQN